MSLGPMSYILTPEISLTTAVDGEQRDVVTVKIYWSTNLLWRTTMNPTLDRSATTYDLFAGDIAIEKGAMVTFSPATELQEGSVAFVATLIGRDGIRTRCTRVIAEWPLTG